MKNIVIITGLPGAGKTTLSLQYEQQGYHMVDDLSLSIDNKAENLEPLMQRVSCFNQVVINDCHLCIPAHQEKMLQLLDRYFPEHEQKWIFFDNNKDHAMVNMIGRNKQYAKSTLSLLYQQYGVCEKIKEKATILKTKKYF